MVVSGVEAGKLKRSGAARLGPTRWVQHTSAKSEFVSSSLSRSDFLF